MRKPITETVPFISLLQGQQGMEAFIPPVLLTSASQTKLVTGIAAHTKSTKNNISRQASTVATQPQASLVKQTEPVEPIVLGSGANKTVVWFRDDLRLHDHPALTAATSRGDCVAALVLVPTSPTAFWADSVADLRIGLRRIGGELYVRHVLSDVATTVAAFCAESGATRLYFHHAVCSDAVRDERAAVTAARRECGVTSRAFWTGALRTPEELPFLLQDMPEDCDEFGRLVANIDVGEPIPPPSYLISVDGLPAGDIPLIRTYSRNNYIDTDEATSVQAGERLGLERIRDYVRDRNLASVDGASNPATIDTKIGRLGPFLTTGCISPRRLWHEVMIKVSANSVRRFCAEFELVLRDFVRMMTLKHGVHPV